MNQAGITVSLQELLDLKRSATNIDITQQAKVRSHLLGGHLSIMRGRGMEFSEVRNYQSGDDIRHMEWRVTARTGKPQVKLYREERERPIFLVVDFNPQMFFGTKIAFKSVIAAKIAAILAWAAIKQGDRIGGLLFSGTQQLELKPLTRRQGVLPLLKGLVDYSQSKPAAQFSLSDACLRLRRIIKPGALIIIISDFNNLDENSMTHFTRLSSHQQLLACYIRDPLEILAPVPGQYAVTNGSQNSILDTNDRTFALEYEHHFAHLYQQRITALHHINIPVINFLTTDNVAVILQQFFD